MKLARLALFYSTLQSIAFATCSQSDTVPLATVKNGTLQGLHLPDFQEDLFLGVRFAEPPIGDLRLRHPVPQQKSWEGVRNATARGLSCPGYSDWVNGSTMGEDCLTLDIVRPSGVGTNAKLPVLVWIYGGGSFIAGGSADVRYNTSYLVNASVAIDKPIIAVSLNYRLAGFGFLASKEIVEADAANIGLWDQHLALQWIQENIGSFGGDSTKVTIVGESAGAMSIGYHLMALDGVNGGLFRGAIMESGSALAIQVNTIPELNTTWQPIYDNITETVGCSKSIDSLACLRTVPYEALYQAFSPFLNITPIVDGTLLPRLPSESLAQGKIADVSLLIGTNTDEGTADFFNIRGTLNIDADVHALLSGLGGGLDNSTVSDLLELYSDDPAAGCPFGTGNERFADQGYQYKRGAAIVGDERFQAGRRATAEYYASLPAERRNAVYSYRFDQPPWNGIEQLIATTAPVYATHYSEVRYVFNIKPSASEDYSDWIGPYPEFYDLSNLMARSWISFVNDLNPNHHKVGGVPAWPEYAERKDNMVFRVNGSVVEADDWRVPQLSYWASMWKELRR
ncbi:Alpha/Beta hydrolase protein [Xylariales sp. AK1849]|nr:Alpha/Beta hydrolase protein [Xylariales sp. AK1849]